MINTNVYDRLKVKNAIQTEKYRGGYIIPKPLIFCPTYNTTREMFNILNEPQTKSLIYGTYGIGKTIGIIMFNQLVLFKAKFMMEAKDNT